jgi:hypothetical protein
MVEGERFGDSSISHHGEANGVDVAEALIVETAQYRLSPLFERLVRVDPLEARTIAN